MHNKKYISKATKDIAAGQEIFMSYGGANWFEDKNLSYVDVDYASTKWRPELHPLPCPQKVVQRIEVDGTRSYVVPAAISAGTVLEVSICLEVPAILVDEFFLRDYILTGWSDGEHTCWSPRNQCSLVRTHHPFHCCLQIPEMREESENALNRFCISPLYSLSSNAAIP